jgi:hypothetical protein
MPRNLKNQKLTFKRKLMSLATPVTIITLPFRISFRTGFLHVRALSQQPGNAVYNKDVTAKEAAARLHRRDAASSRAF